MKLMRAAVAGGGVFYFDVVDERLSSRIGYRISTFKPSSGVIFPRMI